jgi:hypothetical protein
VSAFRYRAAPRSRVTFGLQVQGPTQGPTWSSASSRQAQARQVRQALPSGLWPQGQVGCTPHALVVSSSFLSLIFVAPVSRCFVSSSSPPFLRRHCLLAYFASPSHHRRCVQLDGELAWPIVPLLPTLQPLLGYKLGYASFFLSFRVYLSHLSFFLQACISSSLRAPRPRHLVLTARTSSLPFAPRICRSHYLPCALCVQPLPSLPRWQRCTHLVPAVRTPARAAAAV